MRRRCSLRLDLISGEAGPAWQVFHRSTGANQGIACHIPLPRDMDPAEIIESFNTISRPLSMASLRTWGSDVCNAIFPDQILHELSNFDTGDILFMVPPPWADIPFEILRLPHGFLGERFLVGTIINAGTPQSAIKQHVHRGDMLIIADPSARLQSACREGEDLKAFAASRKRQVKLMMQADREKLIAEIPDASIVHFAGHSDPNGEVGAAGWELSGGGRFDTGDIREAGSGAAMPWLVFSNSCYGGSSGANAGLSGIAGAFLAAGVPQVIGPVCAVRDTDAAHCSLSFYEYLFKGISAAQSLRSIRRATTNGPAGIAPLLYRLFGDPLYREPTSPDFVEDAADGRVKKQHSKIKFILLVITFLLLIAGICLIAVNTCDPNSVIYIPAQVPIPGR